MLFIFTHQDTEILCGRWLRLKDGRINYTEFAAMMRKGDPEVANPKKRRDVVL
jgi:hypothetical protein